jgi:formate hydrogenlyase subunit 4
MPVSADSPLGQVAVLLALMAGIAVVVGTIESVMARVKLLKVSQLLFGAGIVALLGFFISSTGALYR